MQRHVQYLNLIWQRRIHIAPDALEHLPHGISQQYETVFDLARVYLSVLSPLPSGLLAWWLSLPGGHIIIRDGESRFSSGLQVWRGSSYADVLYISPEEAACADEHGFYLFAGMLDSLLGGEQGSQAEHFSSGQGASAVLAEAAQRYVRLAQLGYGLDEWGPTSSHEYWAHAFYLALHAPAQLNRLDPLMLKLYQQTLLSESFWKRVLRSMTEELGS